LGLVRVKVSEVELPCTIVLAPNELPIVGGASTVRVAVLLVEPVPPLFELTALVVLFATAATLPVTVTETVQEPLAPTLAPVRLILFGAKVNKDPPPQATDPPVATVRPAGKPSVNPTPVRSVPALGLVMVKLSKVVLPTGILLAPNASAIVGGASTVRVAVLLVEPVRSLDELTAPVVLLMTPAVVAVTFTEIVQEPPPLTPPPLRATVPLPAVAVSVPPQLLVAFGELATARPAGKVSVKATPVIATGFWLRRVNWSDVVPFNAMVLGLNELLIVGR
jgi:hypothetical protein